MARIINTDGTIVAVEPKNGTDFKLDELHSIVNGYIQIVRIASDIILVVNDSGAINGMPLNHLASLVFRQTLYGNVLLCQSNQVR